LRDARTPQSRQDVIDSFSEKLRAALAQDPEKYSYHWRLQLILISKSKSKNRVAFIRKETRYMSLLILRP
jgi:hypothetical protein